MISNQDPDQGQWPTVSFKVPLASVSEASPLGHGLVPLMDDSPLIAGLQLRIGPGMARLFVISHLGYSS